MDCELINPLYEDQELNRVFNRGKGNTNKMDEKDSRWENELFPEFESELSDRVGEV